MVLISDGKLVIMAYVNGLMVIWKLQGVLKPEAMRCLMVFVMSCEDKTSNERKVAVPSERSLHLCYVLYPSLKVSWLVVGQLRIMWLSDEPAIRGSRE